MSYVSEPFTDKNKIEAELGLSNYATKSDLKNAASIGISQLLKKML